MQTCSQLGRTRSLGWRSKPCKYYAGHIQANSVHAVEGETHKLLAKLYAAFCQKVQLSTGHYHAAVAHLLNLMLQ